MGDEFSNFADNLLNPEEPIQQGGVPAAGPEGAQTSNEQGIPVSALEAGVRQ